MNEIEKGERATSILESQLWGEADAEVKEWLLDKLVEHWQDTKALKELAAFAVAHEKYISFLEVLIENGEIRLKELEVEKHSGQ